MHVRLRSWHMLCEEGTYTFARAQHSGRNLYCRGHRLCIDLLVATEMSEFGERFAFRVAGVALLPAYIVCR